MRIYRGTRRRNSNPTIRIHSLLLSLSETIQASQTNPDISAISENDERVLGNDLYTPPSAFPPLEIHFSGQNGLPLLSTKNGYDLTSVAGCRECMTSAPQDNSGGEGDSSGANPLPPEEKSSKSSKEGRNREAEPRMFAGVPDQHFANDTCCSQKAHTPEMI